MHLVYCANTDYFHVRMKQNENIEAVLKKIFCFRGANNNNNKENFCIIADELFLAEAFGRCYLQLEEEISRLSRKSSRSGDASRKMPSNYEGAQTWPHRFVRLQPTAHSSCGTFKYKEISFKKPLTIPFLSHSLLSILFFIF